MKFTTLIMIVCLAQVSAITRAQINLDERKAPLQKVLKAIGKQSGYGFIYSTDDLKGTNLIDIKLNNGTVEQALKLCFDGQPLVYEVNDKIVKIKRKTEPSLLDKLSTVISNIVRDLTVKGRVIDQEGKPLPNASIRVKGKSAVTNTNQNGEFEIKGVDEEAVLLVSYVGFKTLDISLKDAVMPLEIKLNTATGELEEVNVTYSTGYQNIPKERATGSFVQIDNELFNRTVSTNVLDRISYVTSSLRKDNFNTGSGNGSDISIRGLSTINANQKPLIVIDGFPYEEQGQTFFIALNNINPNDIESVTILRDAAAASIWGARAANGVIVITTKRGRFNQQSNITLNTSVNITERPDLFSLDVISSKDAVEYEKKLFSTGIYNPYDDEYPLSNYFPVVSPVIEILLAKRRGAISSQEADTQLAQLEQHDGRSDILKYLMRPSINQQYNLNISGGGDKMNYYGSAGFDNNLGNIKGNTDNRLSLNFKNAYRPIKNLELNTYINYTQSKGKSNGISQSSFMPGVSVAPYLMLANADGIPLNIPYGAGVRKAYLDTLSTPGLLDWNYSPIDEINNSDNTNFNFSARFGGGLQYTIISGLNASLTGQYDRSGTNIDQYKSLKVFDTRDIINRYMSLDALGRPQYPVPLGGILDYSNNIQNSYNIRGQLSLNRAFGIHVISALVGLEFSQKNYSSNSHRKYGYDPNTLLFATNIDYKDSYINRPGLFPNTIPLASGLKGTLNRFKSYYANVGYTLMNKYTATASTRIDASNFFGVKANQRALPLWSAGASWDIGKENFFKSELFSVLKLRITYGYNGNLDNSISSLPTIGYTNGNNIYNSSQQYATVATGNPNLTWEKVGISNIGIDFTMLKDKLSGSVEYYYKKVTNLIGSVLADPTIGKIEYKGNIAGLKARGIDFSLNGIWVNRAIKVQSSFSISYNEEEITDYYLNPSLLKGPNAYLGFSPIVGKPVNRLYSYKWAGLNPTNGEPMGVISGQTVPFITALSSTAGVSNTKPEDLIYHGRSTPSIFGNVINTLSFRDFSFSFNCTYGLDFYFRRQSINYSSLQNNWTGHGDFSKRWQNPGDELITNVPAVGNDSRNAFYGQSEILVEKGDYIYLQDARVAYSMSKKKFAKMPFHNGLVFININNVGMLWTANKKGLDPRAGYTGLSMSRQIALGLNINF